MSILFKVAKKVLLVAIAGLIILAIWLFVFNRGGEPKTDSLISRSATKPQPSETLKEYLDPAGFTFSYPDNLSISAKELDKEDVYADIQLYAGEVNGSLSLRIADSKLTAIDEWVGLNKSNEEARETKLGDLKARELRLKDRLLLGALDQGVLFTIEIPLIEEDFWMKVYSKILADFSFVAPPQKSNVSQGVSSDVIFEGEEVVD